MHRRATLLVALLLGPALSALPAGASEPSPITDGAEATQLVWEADAGFQGDLALRLRLDAGVLNPCTIRADLVGYTTDRGLRYWGLLEPAGIVFSDRDHRTQEVHVRSNQLAAEQPVGGFVWGATIGVRSAFQGTQTFTLAATDLTSFPPSGDPDDPETIPPARIEISCDEPVRVSALSGSHDVAAFSEDHLSGGLGAFMEGNRSSDADDTHVALADQVQASFDQDTVALQYASGGDDLVSASLLVLEHPGGTETFQHTTGPLDQPRQLRTFEGGPGSYTLTLDRVARGDAAHLAGVIVGLDPVQGLDALA